jgi:hypothetical protein
MRKKVCLGFAVFSAELKTHMEGAVPLAAFFWWRACPQTAYMRVSSELGE